MAKTGAKNINSKINNDIMHTVRSVLSGFGSKERHDNGLKVAVVAHVALCSGGKSVL